MINFNGTLLEKDAQYFNVANRGLRYGDALYETIRVVNGKLFFWEDHYLRLMASMRIMRMDIPMHFTMEYLENEIQKTINSNKLQESATRVRLTVYRNDGGFYTPEINTISCVIEANEISNVFYEKLDSKHEVALFKDHWVNPGLLSTLKTNNKLIHVLAGIYAKENNYDNCLLLNQQKNVVEAVNGNIFLVKGSIIKTPPLTDGCLNGILRKQILRIIDKTKDYDIEEVSISPFELQKADELFITNVIIGIQSVYKYRKKLYASKVGGELLGKLNAIARFS
ncbi:aminotransferase class IV [Leptobacterium sp. I13]|uniref:aminotransferase class IV n=1 Tax=Leptobacterium meishanense TaxID=3128904 RepID=UPI0030EF8C13